MAILVCAPIGSILISSLGEILLVRTKLLNIKDTETDHITHLKSDADCHKIEDNQIKCKEVESVGPDNIELADLEKPKIQRNSIKEPNSNKN